MRLGTHRLTGTRVAIKQIPKAMSAALTREIHHHRQLHHPHVTQLYEVIATESSIWLVTELCCGGELFDYLAEKGRLSEEETRILFGQLCLAIAYVHGKGIVHRDLKLENVLLDERCRVKLGDFGFTREFEKGSLLETFCGTTGYAAPEMLLAKKYFGPGALPIALLSPPALGRVAPQHSLLMDSAPKSRHRSLTRLHLDVHCTNYGLTPFHLRTPLCN